MRKLPVLAIIPLATQGLAACGGSSSTMHGHLSVSYDPLAASGLSSAACLGPMPSDILAGSTQVVVKAPSGSVIGTGTLGSPKGQGPRDLAGCETEIISFTFTVSGLPSESRYGVTIGSHGTVWFTPSQLGHANLSL